MRAIDAEIYTIIICYKMIYKYLCKIWKEKYLENNLIKSLFF